MFHMNTFIPLLVFAMPFLVRADVMPTEPAPGDSFNEGSKCLIAWQGDTNSTTVWKNMAIELMTGDNINMVHLTTVTTGQDGTTSGTFSYTCPQVTPNSAIYFYQFSSPLAPAHTWTGRFTIAASDGTSTPPANSNQPGTTDGVAWGTGQLINPSLAVAPPSFASLASSNSTSVSLPSSTTNSSTSAVASTGSVITSALPTSVITTVVSSSSPTNSASSTTTQSASGALGAMIGFDPRVLGAAVAATLAFSFVW